MTDRRPMVVIAGGGFGGLRVARGLRSAPVDVTVIDRTNHHLFQPLLYQVATAGLSPADIAAPIRNVLRFQANAEVVMAEVTGLDLPRRRVLMGDRYADYDFLVMATGSADSYFGHDEWSRFAIGLKTLRDATSLRQQILGAFEAAEIEPDPQRREALLTFVLVGAGPTGVELAGAISELSHVALVRDFRHIDTRCARIVLLEAGPRILAGFPDSLALAAQRELERHGVQVKANSHVDAVDAHGVVAGGTHYRAETVIWAAGVRATAVGDWLGAGTDRSGRVLVNDDLSAPGHPEVFVIGDAARFLQDGRQLPGLAPVAMQQGDHVARLIKRRVAGGPATAPFHYHDKGNLATVGRSFAILDSRGVKLSGFAAWVAWLVVHIYYLIGFRNRIIVLMQWAWAYLSFQRSARLITTVDKANDAPAIAPGSPFHGQREAQEGEAQRAPEPVATAP